LALVGKAITFDSGGLSIKPAERMEEMVWDKCGGTSVLGAMRGVAALKPGRNIVAILASAENLTGPGAYRPGDIVTTYDGKRIEINNTDAEGRVVLADALGYARRECGAAAIIDLATLTGGCIVALGDTTAGLWSTSDALRDGLLAAAGKSGERFWPMPILPEHEERIKSEVALIKNSSGRPGAACTAAAFLKTFVEATPWAHIDLAGPSATVKDTADMTRGATGFAVRTLLEFVTSPET
jgi:leucyl aminopeptidase